METWKKRAELVKSWLLLMGIFVSYAQLLFNQTLACALCYGCLGVTCVLHLKRIKGLSCASPAQTNMTRVLL